MYELRRHLAALACLFLAAVLCACAGPWHRVPVHMGDAHWQMAPPPGWMHLETASGDMFSMDGPYLSYILVQHRPLDAPFRYTRRTLTAGMLPHEAAGLIADTLSLDPHLHDFELQASEPATIGGHPGFSLTYQYHDAHGVLVKTVYYGLIQPDGFFNLRYTAARRYYFDKDRAAFENLLSSVRIME